MTFVLVDVRGDVGVATADRVGEGVLGLREGEGAGAQALDAEQVACQLHLGVVVERALDAGAAGRPAALANGGHERHDTVLDLGKEVVVEGAGGAALVGVEPGVVGVCLGRAA